MTQASLLRNKYDCWYRAIPDNNKIKLEPWHENALALGIDNDKKRILEVGCGSGDFSIFLSRQGAQVTAIDFSIVAIEAARKKNTAYKTNVNCIVADSQAIPFKNNSFDLIYSFECLEHVLEPRSMLHECSRVLKTNGKIILTTENYLNAMSYVLLYYKLIRRPFDSGSGVQPIENYSLFWKTKKMFLEAGFKKVNFKGSHFVFLLLPGCDPCTFVRVRFKSQLLNFILKPFPRHLVFQGTKL